MISKNIMRYLDQNTVVLCKRNKSCCPIVESDDTGGIKIKDDFGGEVKLTQDEVEMLNEHLSEKIKERTTKE